MLHPVLKRALERYLPADDTEAGYVARMLDLVGTPRAFERGSFEPGHFTASAFVLSPERDALLLVFHKKLSLWLQPGGHVEPDDASALAAARREVAEEVGLTDLTAESAEAPLFDVDIHRIPARPGEPEHEHFDVRFLLQARSRAHAKTDEVADTRWVSLSDLSSVTGDESVLRAARKIVRG